MQWKRMGVIALSVVLVAAPAAAIPVTDPAALAQRITMMANQTTVITNQLTQIQQFSDKLTQMTDQLDHLKQKALGSYHSLTAPFSQLIATKTKLVGTGMGWVNQFQGSARQLGRSYKKLSDGISVRGRWDGLLQAADTVSESDLLNLLSGLPPEVAQRAGDTYRTQREAADRRRVLDHAQADAAATLMESLKEVQDALDKVRNQTQKSDTALAQATVAAIATQAELLAAIGQLEAYRSAREAGASYQRELARRQHLQRMDQLLQESEQDHQDRMAAIRAMPDTGGREIQFKIHPLYQ